MCTMEVVEGCNKMCRKEKRCDPYNSLLLLQARLHEFLRPIGPAKRVLVQTISINICFEKA